MAESISRKRPWLAALLAALVTGLGHLYLRRWRRAIGWIAGSMAAALLFVDPATVEEVGAETVTPELLLAFAPVFAVAALSVVDAYLVARRQNAIASPARTDDERPCPHCGKPLDPDLTFCHWCTSTLEDVEPPVDSSREG